MVCLYSLLVFFFFKQKTAYEMRISDWSSDVCSSDLPLRNACRDGPGIENECGPAVGENGAAGKGRNSAERGQQRRNENVLASEDCTDDEGEAVASCAKDGSGVLSRQIGRAHV